MKRFFVLIGGLLLAGILAACSAQAEPSTLDAPPPTDAATEVITEGEFVPEDSATEVVAEEETAPTATEVVAAEPTAETVVEEEAAQSAGYNPPDWASIELVDARTGETFSLTDYEGKTVYIHPMAMW